MKLRDIYKRAVEKGIEKDPRGREEVQKFLEATRKKFENLPEKEKKFFDTTSLENPYTDTRILYGDPERDVKTIIVGIDMETPEILLADRLRERGKKIDLIIAHHPEGTAYVRLAEVIPMQAGILYKYGVPINVAEALLQERAGEIDRRILPVNHQRSVDAARLLDIPFMCLHTPSDNHVATFLQELFEKEKPYTLADVMDILLSIPEYKKSAEEQCGPRILIGAKERRAGKIFVDMTGGTEGSKKIFQNIVNAGINTLVCMHLSEEHKKEAENSHINVIIAGHISSDNLGMNLLLDNILDEDVEVIEASGFRRFKRK